MAISLARAKRERAALMRSIDREIRAGNRKKLLELRAQVRAHRASRAEAIAAAKVRCAKARQVPTQKQAIAWQRESKREARGACARDLSIARRLRDPIKRAIAERKAEQAHQRQLRIIERGVRERFRGGKGVHRARVKVRETDEEVRRNIPPELVLLFDRVRRQIKGSDRVSRTEEFLEYAETHPDDEWAAIEDRTDEVIRDLERRQRMANPKRKKNAPRLTPAQSRKRFADLKKAGCKPKRVRLGRESVVIRRKACKPPPMPNPARKRAKKNPRRPPKRWFDRCLRGVEGRRYARDPAAVCAAAWWRRPPKEREAIVRRLERGTRRERRTAVGIAKAERNRADGPRRRNPSLSDAEARREYERTHWGDRGRDRVRKGRAADPRHGTAAELGELVAVVYRTHKKGDGKKRGKRGRIVKRRVDYEHEFEGRRPRLAYNDGGLLVVGGDYRIKEGGITG